MPHGPCLRAVRAAAGDAAPSVTHWCCLGRAEGDADGLYGGGQATGECDAWVAWSAAPTRTWGDVILPRLQVACYLKR